MFFSLDNRLPIIGMDFSYSDERCKKVSVYFKSTNSMIVDPSFLELLAMMNGLFDKESILNYAEKVLSYRKAYVNSILDEMISWNVAHEESSVNLWGSSFDKEFSKEFFSHFDVRFISATPALIDLSLLLCKYNFNSISFSDDDIKIQREDVKSSVLLQESDIGRSLSSLIAMRRNGNCGSSIDEHSPMKKACETIFLCDSPTKNNYDNCDILLDVEDYRNNPNFCRGLAFKASSCGKQIDSQLVEFEHVLKMESDVVFGVIDGFYE